MDPTRYMNKSEEVHCPYCCNDGWVLLHEGESRQTLRREPGPHGQMQTVARGTHMVDVAVPCPNCEIGYLVEFPTAGLAPWGREGYWRGRPTGLVKRCACDERPLPRDENKALFDQHFGPLIHRLQTGIETPAEVAAPSIFHVLSESPPPDTVDDGRGDPSGSHICPSHSKRNVPWSEEDCSHCHPADAGDLIDF